MTALLCPLVVGSYRLPVDTEDMSPRYRPGEQMLIHPDAVPHAGEDVLISRDRGDGTRETMLRRLVKVTRNTWRVQRLTPRRIETLDRRQWPKAELVVGMLRPAKG